MYHYDPQTALDDLQEDALLPNPAHVRDMITRAALTPPKALRLNRELQIYMRSFAETQQTVRRILEELAQSKS